MSSLFLRFGIGEGLFAMGTSEIEEVLPLVVWTPIPRAPKGVAGVFGYRGEQVPLLDLSELMSGNAANVRMSTRIILIRQRESARSLGLLAEHVTETFRASDNHFRDSGVSNAAAPYLGRLIQRGDETLQHVDIHRLLDSELAKGVLAIDRDGAH